MVDTRVVFARNFLHGIRAERFGYHALTLRQAGIIAVNGRRAGKDDGAGTRAAGGLQCVQCPQVIDPGRIQRLGNGLRHGHDRRQVEDDLTSFRGPLNGQRIPDITFDQIDICGHAGQVGPASG